MFDRSLHSFLGQEAKRLIMDDALADVNLNITKMHQTTAANKTDDVQKNLRDSNQCKGNA
jgi:hypothetical protein